MWFDLQGHRTLSLWNQQLLLHLNIQCKTFLLVILENILEALVWNFILLLLTGRLVAQSHDSDGGIQQGRDEGCSFKELFLFSFTLVGNSNYLKKTLSNQPHTFSVVKLSFCCLKHDQHQTPQHNTACVCVFMLWGEWTSSLSPPPVRLRF